jgi:hypothetical protein
MGGGGTLISVYPDDLTFLCKFLGVPEIFFAFLQNKNGKLNSRGFPVY